MNYWHIQLHPNDRDAFPPNKIKEILEQTSLIGMGDWDEGHSQINQFTNDVEIGDIVLVRSNGLLKRNKILGTNVFWRSKL